MNTLQRWWAKGFVVGALVWPGSQSTISRLGPFETRCASTSASASTQFKVSRGCPRMREAAL